MKDSSLDEILQKVEELPTLSSVMYRVWKLTSEPKTSIQDLTETIINDQVLTAKVLRMANSAYYGYSRRIFSISEALIILGFNTVRNLALAASVYNILSSEFKGYLLTKGDLWKHSISTALLARSLAKRIGYEFPEQAFVAGLLHDIGKIVLNTYMKKSFEEVMEIVVRENVPFMEAEDRILGFDHAYVGSLVVEKWKLPQELVEAISYHHSPALAQHNPKLTAITHVADAAIMSMGVGLGGDGLLYPFDGIATEQLNLTEAIIEETIAEVADSLIEAVIFIEK